MKQDIAYRSFLQVLVITTASLLATAAACNFVIDPYGLFGVVSIDGLNWKKPSAVTRTRVTKVYQVGRSDPKTLIAGNSRPEIGLDPESSCWSAPDKPIYNISLAGSSVYMMARYIQHAAHVADVDTILWGLDFKDFYQLRYEGDTGLPEKLKFESRLSVDADGGSNISYRYNLARDHLRNLFSLNTLSDSVYTVMAQSSSNISTIRQDGFHPADHHLEVFRLEGQGLVFKQKNIELVRAFSEANKSLFDSSDDWSAEFESVRLILQMAESAGIEVKLFINPYHADYLNVIDLADLWDEFERWKKGLTMLALKHDVELWDFSEMNAYARQPPPELNDRKSVLEWFWEPAHYRREYGDLMLARMTGSNCGKGAPVNIGIRLNEDNLRGWFDRQRSLMDDYRRDEPGSVRRIEGIFSRSNPG